MRVPFPDVTGPEFVRGVMERLEVESAAALADKLGWPRGKERTVARWLAGTTNPSYENIIEMVERAGLLSTPEGRQKAPADPGDPLEALAEHDEAILLNQGEGMRLLREIHAMLAKHSTSPSTAPKRKAH